MTGIAAASNVNRVHPGLFDGPIPNVRLEVVAPAQEYRMASATIVAQVPAGFRINVSVKRHKNGLVHGYPDSTYRAELSLEPDANARCPRSQKIPIKCTPLFEGRYRFEVCLQDSNRLLATSGDLYKQDPY